VGPSRQARRQTRRVWRAFGGPAPGQKSRAKLSFRASKKDRGNYRVLPKQRKLEGVREGVKLPESAEKALDLLEDLASTQKCVAFLGDSGILQQTQALFASQPPFDTSVDTNQPKNRPSDVSISPPPSAIDPALENRSTAISGPDCFHPVHLRWPFRPTSSAALVRSPSHPGKPGHPLHPVRFGAKPVSTSARSAARTGKGICFVATVVACIARPFGVSSSDEITCSNIGLCR